MEVIVMGKMKELFIEEQPTKELPSIIDLPRIMAEHRFKMGYYEDLLTHILRIKSMMVMRDLFNNQFKEKK
jgi:hypothetical protein